jgi:hypothetical protein
MIGPQRNRRCRHFVCERSSAAHPSCAGAKFRSGCFTERGVVRFLDISRHHERQRRQNCSAAPLAVTGNRRRSSRTRALCRAGATNASRVCQIRSPSAGRPPPRTSASPRHAGGVAIVAEYGVDTGGEQRRRTEITHGEDPAALEPATLDRLAHAEAATAVVRSSPVNGSRGR